MTNGEKIKATFPHYDIEIDEHKGYVRVFFEDFYTTYPLRWWNTEHKEPTAKCKDKITMPYATPDNCGNYIEQTTTNDLGVDYTINGLDDFIKFGKKAFGVELTIKALEQEPILDKIRAEIKSMSGDIETIADVLQIIDKYKAEKE